MKKRRIIFIVLLIGLVNLVSATPWDSCSANSDCSTNELCFHSKCISLIANDSFSTNPSSNALWDIWRRRGDTDIEAVWANTYLALQKYDGTKDVGSGLRLKNNVLNNDSWVIEFDFKMSAGDDCADGIYIVFDRYKGTVKDKNFTIEYEVYKADNDPHDGDSHHGTPVGKGGAISILGYYVEHLTYSNQDIHCKDDYASGYKHTKIEFYQGNIQIYLDSNKVIDYNLSTSTYSKDFSYTSFFLKATGGQDVANINIDNLVIYNLAPVICSPATSCSAIGKQCGTWDNGCGTGTLDCGTTCPGGQQCNSGAGICEIIPRCSDAQTILRVSDSSNAHGALYNDTNYNQDICYKDIFGFDYLGASPHDCTGSNKVVGLSAIANAHGETNAGTNYASKVCYGTLNCRAVNTSITGQDCTTNEEEEIVSLNSYTNAHFSKTASSDYPIKICCKTGALASLRFEKMNGVAIEADGSVEIGDSLKIIADVSNIDLTDKNITYIVYKERVFWWDKKIAQFSNKAYTVWKTNETGEFYFAADTTDGNLGESESVFVTDPANDASPEIRVVNPVLRSNYTINPTTSKTDDISFEQIANDEDDNLNILWNFGDSKTARFTDCMSWGNCNTTHNYSASGTKIITAEAEESIRGKSTINYTVIFIYKEGLNIFAIIDKPNYIGVLQEPGLYELDGRSSHIANCSFSSAACNEAAGAGKTCYDVVDAVNPSSVLYCYKFLESNALTFQWTINNVISTHTNNEPFPQMFKQSGEHYIKLKVSYVI